nr:Daple [Micromonospora chaiyaphumensis]
MVRRAAREDEPVARRAAREEWAAEPSRPYEPARVEPPAGYDPPRPEPVHPYEPVRAEAPAGYEAARPEPSRPYEVPEPRTSPEPAGREIPERPTWAGPPVPVTPFSAPPHTTPTSAPPMPREAPAGYPPAPAVRAAEEREGVPYRLPGGAERPPAAPAGPPPVPVDRIPAPAPTSAPPYAARRSAPEPPPAAEAVADDPTPVLPQRVPAEPDVPVVPEPPAVEPSAETPELARIATHLRRDDEPAPLRERPEGFDVNAILDAVREVAGVRDAALRRTPAGAHSLRLDLADGADPAEVSRVVARLLQERMGLAAAPQNLPGAPAAPPPPVRRRSAQPRADRPAEPRPADDRPGAARSGVSSPPAEDASRPAWSTPQSRPAEEPAGAARPGPAEEPAGPRSGPQSRTAEGLAGPQSRAAEEPAGPRSGPNRPAENRSGEGRFAAPEARAARLADAPAEGDEPPRRRRQASAHRGRAAVEESSLAAAPAGTATGSPATLGTSYSGGQMSTTETAPSRPLDTGGLPGPRVVIDHVQVSTFGLDATVEVRLLAGDRTAEGHSTGPAVDGYVLRLCAVAAAAAVDELLGRVPAGERGRCFVEHAAVVPFGNCEVATVVVLLVCDGWVEQLAGSALVAGDPRQAVVRATLAAVNRRLEALLA